MSLRKYYFLLFALLSFAGTSRAYTRIKSAATPFNSPAWPRIPIPYWINDRGLSQILNGSEFNAIHAAFQTWEGVSTAQISFDYKGTTEQRTLARDGINLITFADDATQSILGSSTIAATFSFFTSNTTVIEEADIVFSQSLSFATSGETGKYDIQSVLTHEIGHFVGLDHSGLVSSVMVPFAAPGQLEQRTLAYDDIAGVSEIYPRAVTGFAPATIRGSVMAGAAPVFGAHVVAVDATGTPLVSTLSLRNGSYSILGLPAGSYRIYAEPLDSPVSAQNIGGYYTTLTTNFGTTVVGGPITVDAGAEAIANIQTVPPSSMNLTRPSSGVRIARGVSGTLRNTGGHDIVAPLTVSTSSNVIILGAQTFRTQSSSTVPTVVDVEITIPTSTPLGPKNIIVTRGAETSIVSGGIVIVDPQPSGITVSPNAGPTAGGTGITISGANFRPGARVEIDGLPATDVRVLSSNSIEATTPRDVPGSANVLVINADGTYGVAARAFTYSSEFPSISSIDPLLGPPSTLVTIRGEHFDSRIQNIEVRFNGVSGRVTSAGVNEIQARVPFGATTGPVTVSVFSQTATGPEFLVTSPPASTNIALSRYAFIDASSGAGGTDLSFSSVDDATSIVALPFNFTLFTEIYLAGSSVNVATNGWLSLEPASPEFENPSLPAQTFVRTAGGLGSAPASLIAPFFDDLVVVSGVSSVSTRTLGTTPNRRFVIQWSNMDILGENGQGLGARLTFQAVLYEGSNDIQFVYKSLSGNRSNGSSATVGLQDVSRTVAVQTSFNQPFLTDAYFITYRFNNGGYSTPGVDSTPPARPLVTDAGATTRRLTELSASWTAEDPESGIAEFRYAIGRTPGGEDIRTFTTITENSVTATGLQLEVGSTYYFSVQAINGAGLVSEIGVSDGIRIDPSVQTYFKWIPWSPQNSSVFSGIALLAPVDMSVVIRALNANGTLASVAGARNPVTITLSAGQQYARLVEEFVGLGDFDGWLELEASAPGLGVYVATGTWDLKQLDGSVPREPSADFVLFHPGAEAVLANPSPRGANVTIEPLGAGSPQTVTIPPRSVLRTIIPGAVHVRSSEPLAAIDRFSSAPGPGKLGIGSPENAALLPQTLVFPQAVTGGGYTSTVTLANTTNTPSNLTLSFAGASKSFQLEGRSVLRVSLDTFLNLPISAFMRGPVTVTPQSSSTTTGSVVGTLEIENAFSLLSLGAPPASTQVTFPHVANGDGYYTGLAIVAGSSGATVTVDVYPSSGSNPKSATFTIDANQQVARFIGELVPSVTKQLGGYIQIRSDQPIWAWEIYVSDQSMASGPPL